jgi:hypothetical protein
MGSRGPVPKRSDQRRRRNKPDRDVKTSPAKPKVPCPDCGKRYSAGAGLAAHRRAVHPDATDASDPESPPAVDELGRLVAPAEWHPVAKHWYDSLPASGQHVFYEPSDWATAFVIAESISRELHPQPVYDKEGIEVARVARPPKGASMAAWLKGMSSLLVTEGDRRRLQIELTAASDGDGDEEAADVAHIADARERLRGPS